MLECWNYGPEAFSNALGRVRQYVTQRLVAHAALLLVADAVAIAQTFDGNDSFAHGCGNEQCGESSVESGIILPL